MLTRTVSIFFYVVSGYFLAAIPFIGFINQVPAHARLIVMGMFFVLGLILLSIGLTVRQYVRWKRDAGVVMLSAAIVSGVTFLGMHTLSLFPVQGSIIDDNLMHLYSDYFIGSLSIVVSASIGMALILEASKEAKAQMKYTLSVK